jgi:octaprenyl-diphosphate synthase
LINLVERLSDKLEYINNALIELDLSHIHSLLQVPAKFAVAGGGKRLRPIICVYCTEVVGGDYRDARDAFLALELIHSGTLVHDDIIDEDLFRRGTSSVPVKFGGKRAVLTGDALLSLGLKYATKTGKLEVVNWLSETALKMVQGVALQTFYRRKLVTEPEYLNINYLKSGSLFEAAAALGGLIGSESPDDSRRLAEFGKNFGNAYQIRDDICSVYSEDRNDYLSRNDILNGDASLPFIYALESEATSEGDRNTLISMFKVEREKIDLAEVQRIYEDTGALEKSIKKMKEFAERGHAQLNCFERTEAKEFLNYLIDQYYKQFSPERKLEIII